MPIKPPTPCLHPGCRALVEWGAYCSTHKATRKLASSRSSERARLERAENSAELSTAAAIRSTAHWHKCSAIIRARHPLCCDPFARHRDTRPALAMHVHHIEAVGKRPDLAFSEDNLAPLCYSCHASIEARERRGQSTAHLFAQLLSVKNLSLPHPAAELASMV